MVSWRYIMTLLMMLGLVTSGAILVLVFWLTHRVDTVERANLHRLVTVYLTASETRVQNLVEDYADWNLAYQIVLDRDDDAIAEHIGSGATDSNVFDVVVILSPDEQLLYDFGDPSEVNINEEMAAGSLTPVLDALREIEPTQREATTGIAVVSNRLAVASAARITPEDITPDIEQTLPILIGISFLDAGWLMDLENMSDASKVRIDIGRGESGPTQLAMIGFQGNSLGVLRWKSPETGTRLRRNVMPAVLIVCVGLFGVCLSAVRYFHHQNGRLTRANRIASTDQLTGLLNRAGLDALLQDKVFEADIECGHVAVLYLDLNDFKALNDKFGHQSGDIALKVLAERLQAAVRKTDYVSRVGGDEFVCVVVDPNPEEAARHVGNRLFDLMQSPISFSEHDQILQASLGVALSSSGTQWETLLSRADAAMYWAKKKKIRSPVFFTKSMYDEIGSAAPQ